MTDMTKRVSLEDLMRILTPPDTTADERVSTDQFFLVPISHFAEAKTSISGDELRKAALRAHAICICSHEDLRSVLERNPLWKGKTMWAFGSIFSLKEKEGFGKQCVIGYNGIYHDWTSRLLENPFYAYGQLLCAKRKDCPVPKEFVQYCEFMNVV